MTSYQETLEIVKKTARWAAFIDVDEFLVPMQKNDLVSFLKDYEQYPGVVINWQMYGTSGYDNIPEDCLLTETLIFKANEDSPSHNFIKSIVQPSYITLITDPPSFHYLLGYFAVNSEGLPHLFPGSGCHPYVFTDRIRVNHYWFGTKNWFLHSKLPRREKWGIKFSIEHLEEFFQLCNQIKDESILRFTPALRQKTFKTKAPFTSKTIFRRCSKTSIG